MEPISFSAKTLDDAITKACIELGVTSETIDYTVVDAGSKGLLGIGARPCVISVRLKGEEPEAEVRPSKASTPAAAPAPVAPTAPAALKAQVTDLSHSQDPREQAMEFLSSIFEGMSMNVDIDAQLSDNGSELSIVLSGDDMGVLIGKRGQTLDAIQYLTGQVVNKHSESYIRVKIDTENYRERRKETLETLAKNIAHKVKRTRRPVALEPMNPYERRIIHSVLQSDKDVFTRSEGEEPYRHVVVCLQKRKKN